MLVRVLADMSMAEVTAAEPSIVLNAVQVAGFRVAHAAMVLPAVSVSVAVEAVGIIELRGSPGAVPPVGLLPGLRVYWAQDPRMVFGFGAAVAVHKEVETRGVVGPAGIVDFIEIASWLLLVVVLVVVVSLVRGYEVARVHAAGDVVIRYVRVVAHENFGLAAGADLDGLSAKVHGYARVLVLLGGFST